MYSMNLIENMFIFLIWPGVSAVDHSLVFKTDDLFTSDKNTYTVSLEAFSF